MNKVEIPHFEGERRKMSDEEIKAVMEACEKTRKNQVKSLLNKNEAQSRSFRGESSRLPSCAPNKHSLCWEHANASTARVAGCKVCGAIVRPPSGGSCDESETLVVTPEALRFTGVRFTMLQKMRICPVCGKNMAHLHKSRIYCSGACYQDRLGPHKRRTTQAPRFR